MKYTKLIAILFLIVLGITIQVFVNNKSNKTDNQPVVVPNPIPNLSNQESVKTFASPIENADKRVTKKPFGIYVNLKNSPVQPERFVGYHNATDFETFAEEANSEVSFYAICDGKILQKRTASGYGGLIVQACSLDNQPITVIYGHVSLKNISKIIGDNLSKGEKVGILGQQPTETDGERKHLHLGIHKGATPNIQGYVQNPSELDQWIDFQTVK